MNTPPLPFSTLRRVDLNRSQLVPSTDWLTRLFLLIGLLCALPSKANSNPPDPFPSCAGYLGFSSGRMTGKQLARVMRNEEAFSPLTRIEAYQKGRGPYNQSVLLVELEIVDRPTAQVIDSRQRRLIARTLRQIGAFMPWITIGLNGTHLMIYLIQLMGPNPGPSFLLENLPSYLDWQRYFSYLCPTALFADGVRYCYYQAQARLNSNRFLEAPPEASFVDDVPLHLRALNLAGATVIIYTTPSRVDRIRRTLLHELGFSAVKPN